MHCGACAGRMAFWTGMTLAMYATILMTVGGMTTSPSPASAAGTASSWQKPSRGPYHCQRPSKSWKSLTRSLTGGQPMAHDVCHVTSLLFCSPSAHCTSTYLEILHCNQACYAINAVPKASHMRLNAAQHCMTLTAKRLVRCEQVHTTCWTSPAMPVSTTCVRLSTGSSRWQPLQLL